MEILVSWIEHPDNFTDRNQLAALTLHGLILPCSPDKPGAALWDTLLSRPHGVALVLIYPCGKAWNSPPKGALT